jgi:hypothetical protein
MPKSLLKRQAVYAERTVCLCELQVCKWRSTDEETQARMIAADDGAADTIRALLGAWDELWSAGSAGHIAVPAISSNGLADEQSLA